MQFVFIAKFATTISNAALKCGDVKCMACADLYYDSGYTTDAINPNARNVTEGTSKIEVCAEAAKVKAINEPRSTPNSSHSSRANKDKWEDIPYLKLRPARAVQMLTIYDNTTVVGACHHLAQTGQLINTIHVYFSTSHLTLY